MSRQKNLPFRILQWNCRSINIAKKESLVKALQKHNISVVALSETWLSPSVNFLLSGYVVVRQDRSSSAANGQYYGGVLIAVKESLYRNTIKLNALPAEIAGCTITISGKSLDVFSFYIPPNANSIEKCFDEIVANSKNSLIMLGDANSHSKLWGCDHDDRRGDQMLERIEYYDLTILNDGSITRISSPTVRPSAIDLTICSNNLALDAKWKTLADSMGSDHLPILIDMGTECVVRQNCIERFDRTKCIDWEKYKKNVDIKIEVIAEPENDPELYHKLVNIICTCAKESKPIVQRKRVAYNPQPWWNSACDKAVDDRMEATKVFLRRSCTSRADYENLRLAENAAHNCITKEKRMGWHRYATTLDPSTPETRLWSTARKYCGKSSTVAMPNNSEIIDSLLDKLAIPYVCQPPTIDCHSESEILSSVFTFSELELAFSSMKKTAVGVDGISYNALKNLPHSGKKMLLYVFNKILRLEISIPNSWYDCVTLAFLKPGKDSSLADSYRPISLLSCVRKTFEKLLSNRLVWWLEKCTKLPDTQFGFRRNKGTRDALALLHAEILSTFSRKQNMLALFVDIKGAFNNVRIEILCKKLSKMKMDPIFVRIIWELFRKRKIWLPTLWRTRMFFGSSTRFCTRSNLVQYIC